MRRLLPLFLVPLLVAGPPTAAEAAAKHQRPALARRVPAVPVGTLPALEKRVATFRARMADAERTHRLKRRSWKAPGLSGPLSTDCDGDYLEGRLVRLNLLDGQITVEVLFDDRGLAAYIFELTEDAPGCATRKTLYVSGKRTLQHLVWDECGSGKQHVSLDWVAPAVLASLQKQIDDALARAPRGLPEAGS